MATHERNIPVRDPEQQDPDQDFDQYLDSELGGDDREPVTDDSEEGGVLRWAGEVGRSVLRGASKGLVTEPLDMVGELTGVEALEVPDDEWVPDVLGQKSDDGFAQMVEGFTQFGSAFIGLGKLKWGGKALNAYRGWGELASAAGRGAVVDFAAFDPFEGGVASLISESRDQPFIPDISADAAEFVAVEEDDSNLEARIKMTLQGAVLGTVADGVIAGLRVVRGKRALREAVEAGDEAAIREAGESLEENLEILRKVNNAEHTSEADEFVEVVQREDGQFEIVGKVRAADEVPEGFTTKADPFVDEFELPENPELIHVTTAIDDVNRGGLRPRNVTGNSALGGGPGDLVSVAYSPRHAQRIQERLTLVVRAARGEADFADVLSYYTDAFNASGTPRPLARSLAEINPFFREGTKGVAGNIYENWEDFDRLVQEEYAGDPARLAIDLDAGADDAFRSLGGVTQGGDLQTVGILTDVESLSRIDPDQIGTVRVAVREGADPQKVSLERELRFEPDDVRVVREGADRRLGPFRDRGEVEAQAASIENNLRARSSKNIEGKLTAFQKQEILDRTRALLRSAREGDDEAIERLAEGTHFNFSTYAEEDATLSVLEAMTEVMEKQFRAASEADGVPIQETIDRARQRIGGMPESQISDEITQGLDPLQDSSVRFLAGDMLMKDLARQVGELGTRLESRPHDKALLDHTRKALTNLFRVARRVSGARSEIGRTLRLMQDLGDDAAGSSGFREAVEKSSDDTGDAVVTEGKKRVAKETAGTEVDPEELVAGWEPRDVRAVSSMMAMTDEPRHLTSAIKAVRVYQATGKMAKAQELFINGILSAPTTLATVAQSALSIGVFEPGARILAGLKNADPALIREGRDLLYGAWKFASEGFEAMKRAWKAGHSIIDTQPTTKAIGGQTGEVVRLPSRSMMSIDEFIKVVQYRSWIRAKTLRRLRGQGLSPEELQVRVEDNLKKAFDEETGVATIPEGMEYAKTATMSSPLSTGTAGRTAARAIADVPILRFIAPFTRAPANILAYARDVTPLVNRSTKRMRAVFKEGGEEAAIAHARSQIVGAALTGMAGLYAADYLTGGGPEDPSLRKNWLQTHEPYSIRIPSAAIPGAEEDKWISFRRMDPLALPFGIMADVFDSVQHAQEEYSETGVNAIFDAGVAVFSGLTEAISNRSYLQSLADAFGAISGNQMNQAQRLFSNIAGGFIPFSSLQRNLNPDPVLREARGITDQLMRGIPGLSSTLPPVFNFYGEKVYKSPGGILQVINMVNPNDIQNAPNDPVVKRLLEIGEGVSPPSPTMRIHGQPVVDLLDENLKSRPDQKLPYVRWMELVRNPQYNRQNLREELTELVTSERFRERSEGTPVFPGGEQMARIQAVVDKHYARAKQQMFREYPKVKALLKEGYDAFGGAMQGDEDAPESIEDIRGLIRQ